MTHSKLKFVVYGIVAFSLSLFFGMASKGNVCEDKVTEYFLKINNDREFDIREYFLGSFYDLEEYPQDLSKINEPVRINETEERDIYVSDDKNIVIEGQNCRGLDFCNETDYTIDEQSMLLEKPHLSFGDKSSPQILIVHTHASESYDYKRTYPLTDTDRTQDNEYNMIRIGRELKNELEQKGYNVIHDKTVHDYPSYTSSYQRAGETVSGYLKKYPSIVAVFDIHRDAVINNQGKKVALVSEQNGEQCAQVMIVCGTDGNNLKFDTWEENLRFAFKIQDYMQRTYPGIMRPVNIRKERFNLHLTRGSLLFEIGTNGNSLTQALNSVKYLCDGIDNAIQTIKSITP